MAKFTDLVTKARARQDKERPDYVLEIGDEKYTIPYPDAQSYLEFSTLDDNETLEQLKVIFRSQPVAFNALMRALKGEPVEVIDALLSDMFTVWQDDSFAQPGKSKA